MATGTPVRPRFDPAPAGSLLAEAWRSGSQLAELPIEIRPRTLEEGYDVQDCLIEQLGGDIVGWKLGVGSPKAKREAGLARAIAGRVLGAHRYRPGDTVRLASAHPATVEFEVAFVLARDVAPDEPPPAPAAVIASAHVAVELVLARFVDRRAVGWPSFAADDAGFAALVVGEPIDVASIPAIGASVRVCVGGKELARRVADEDLIDPLAALGEMLAHARERRIPLRRGSIVATGTLSRPFNIAGRSNDVVARYLDAALPFRTEAREQGPRA
jgi:2-keto-4-pentenoate hydratase